MYEYNYFGYLNISHDIIKCIQISTKLIFMSILNIHKICGIQIKHLSLHTDTHICLPTFICCSCYGYNICDVGCYFYKEWNFYGCSHPLANVTDKYWILHTINKYHTLRLLLTVLISLKNKTLRRATSEWSKPGTCLH